MYLSDFYDNVHKFLSEFDTLQLKTAKACHCDTDQKQRKASSLSIKK